MPAMGVGYAPHWRSSAPAPGSGRGRLGGVEGGRHQVVWFETIFFSRFRTLITEYIKMWLNGFIEVRDTQIRSMGTVTKPTHNIT